MHVTRLSLQNNELHLHSITWRDFFKAFSCDYFSTSTTGLTGDAEPSRIFSGLGSAVAEVLASSASGTPLKITGMQDTHAESGPYPELQHKYGLDAEALAAAVRETVSRK